MYRDGFMQWLATDAGRAAVAGALGGIVRWVVLKEKPAQAVGSLVVGSICAIYLGPLVAPMMEPFIGKLAPDAPESFSSFVVGMGGISIASFVIEILNARKKGGRDDQA